MGGVLRQAPGASPAADCDGRGIANDRRAKDEYPDSCRSPSAAENFTIMGPMRQGVEGVDPGHLPVPPRSGSGKYRSISPNAKDRAYEEALYALVGGAKLKGLPHAAAYMRHYLDGTGKPVKVDPDELMDDMRDFATMVDGYYLPTIDADYCREFSEAFAANGGRPFNKSFQGRWELFYIEKNDSEDWYYALGGIYHSASGYITAVPSGRPGAGPTLTMHYRVHVHDGYDWNKKAGDDGKVDIGPFKIRDEQQGRLHETGLAQDYDVDGSTEMKTRVMDCPGT
ncbi:hypothetical protein [Actinomadura sp. HBU206391]|uniref:hypothetical protein n=1 Tax=Actinomadura sp. HBU206391 TaxID=2731692 RepID=UPI00164FC519|nr:hypothetical protein [Actinomadura sp. HBU206391]MBC6461613.1 hypothetical protein [Actinomadura sp. HBU206391]